jgi:hypothetical protein
MLNPRHRLLDSKLDVDRTLGAECVRYDQLVEDTGVPQFPGARFTMRAQGLRCLHPQRSGYVVEAGYSQRLLHGQPPLSIEAEAEPFVRSIVFR